MAAVAQSIGVLMCCNQRCPCRNFKPSIVRHDPSSCCLNLRMFCPLGKSRLLMHLKSNLSWKRPAFLFAHPSHQLSIGRSRYHRGFLTRWKYSSLSEKPLKLLEGRRYVYWPQNKINSPVAIRSKSLKRIS